MSRFTCEECNWNGPEEDVLRAPNPFSEDVDTIMGCPDCRDVNTLRLACDEPGCCDFVTCGTPAPNGYRRTCSDHVPRG